MYNSEVKKAKNNGAYIIITNAVNEEKITDYFMIGKVFQENAVGFYNFLNKQINVILNEEFNNQEKKYTRDNLMFYLENLYGITFDENSNRIEWENYTMFRSINDAIRKTLHNDLVILNSKLTKTGKKAKTEDMLANFDYGEILSNIDVKIKLMNLKRILEPFMKFNEKDFVKVYFEVFLNFSQEKDLQYIEENNAYIKDLYKRVNDFKKSLFTN